MTWLFIFWDSVSGKAILAPDAFSFFCVTKFFVDSLAEGVFPLWNPWLNFGEPYIRQIGEYNPIWGVVMVLNKIGFAFPQAFIGAQVAYFIIGAVGFYLLAKKIYQDQLIAAFCFGVILFSSLGANLFNQPTTVMVFVPAVWFVYFLCRFYAHSSTVNFLGLIFWFALIVTTYIPFYFGTFFGFLVLLMLIFFPVVLGRFLKLSVNFIRTHCVTAFLGVLVLSLSVVSAWATYQLVQSDLVVPVRHAGSPMTKGINVDYEQQASVGAMMVPLGTGFFTDALLDVDFSNDRFVFLPWSIVFILTAFPFGKVNRRMLLLSSLGILLLFLCLTKATFLNKFLYDFVPLFRIFRNYHLLIPFLVGVIAFFVSEQLKAAKEEPLEGRMQRVGEGWIVMSHLLWFLFLKTQDDILNSTYWALGASLVFCLLWRVRPKASWTTYGLFLSLWISVEAQPVEAWSAFQQKARDFKAPYIERGLLAPAKRSEFSPVRPAADFVGTDVDFYNYYYSFLAWRESSPLLPYLYGYPPERTYFLAQNISSSQRTVFRNKLITFQAIGPEESEPELTGPQAWMGNSSELSVEKFNPNEVWLKTDLAEERFLVLTDSYHGAWKAWLNKRDVPVQIALGAFKGLRLPAGVHEVRLAFEPWGKSYLPWSVLLGVYALFFYLCCNLNLLVRDE